MAIDDRNLPAGTVLAASYKKAVHTCTVEQDAEGRRAYVLADGRRFRSPSAAGSAVMGGIACNGWRFWSLAEATANAAGPQPETTLPPARKPGPLLRRVPNQRGVPDGQARYFCPTCRAGFLTPSDAVPGTCPQGHGADAVEAIAVEV